MAACLEVNATATIFTRARPGISEARSDDQPYPHSIRVTRTIVVQNALERLFDVILYIFDKLQNKQNNLDDTTCIKK